MSVHFPFIQDNKWQTDTARAANLEPDWYTTILKTFDASLAKMTMSTMRCQCRKYIYNFQCGATCFQWFLI